MISKNFKKIFLMFLVLLFFSISAVNAETDDNISISTSIGIDTANIDNTQQIDNMINIADKNEGTFINHKTKAIILDFIGGEPLMNIDIIDYVCTYFVEKCVEKNHPWLYTWRASIISNGALYFDPKVQAFLKKFTV